MKLKNQFRIFLAVMMMAMFAAPSRALAQETVTGEGTGTGTSPVNPGTGTDTPAETGAKLTYENGTVTTDKMSAAEGETVTLTVTPDDGYHLASLYLVGDNGMVYFPTQSTTDPSKYTVILFQVNAFTTLRVHATFEKDNDNPSQGSGTGGGSGDANTFSITVTADPAEGGTVTGGSSGSYAKDTRLEFKETPNEGYRFKNWTINGINEDGEGEVDQDDIDAVVKLIMEPKDKGDE